MTAARYLLLVLLAPQVLADLNRAELRRRCAELVLADRGVA